MATTTAAEVVGLGEVTGQVRAGFVADLVLLPTSPGEDLKGALGLSSSLPEGSWSTSGRLRPKHATARLPNCHCLLGRLDVLERVAFDEQEVSDGAGLDDAETP